MFTVQVYTIWYFSPWLQTQKLCHCFDRLSITWSQQYRQWKYPNHWFFVISLWIKSETLNNKCLITSSASHFSPGATGIEKNTLANNIPRQLPMGAGHCPWAGYTDLRFNVTSPQKFEINVWMNMYNNYLCHVWNIEIEKTRVL